MEYLVRKVNLYFCHYSQTLYICNNLNDMPLNKVDLSINGYLNTFFFITVCKAQTQSCHYFSKYAINMTMRPGNRFGVTFTFLCPLLLRLRCKYHSYFNLLLILPPLMLLSATFVVAVVVMRMIYKNNSDNCKLHWVVFMLVIFYSCSIFRPSAK